MKTYDVENMEPHLMEASTLNIKMRCPVTCKKDILEFKKKFTDQLMINEQMYAIAGWSFLDTPAEYLHEGEPITLTLEKI